ncbi:MAG: dephospho-CoA kinase [candidate division Zixibacteria bacterium]|nr:dephospho-CoA kinase [candidate division Zixibacteria bacterium]
MLIGVTGQIGAGKSTAAAILKSFGAAVVDADKIGRQVVDDNPPLLRWLVRAFGDRILNRRGNLDRRRLAALAFENDASGQRLNQLVHPYLLKELHRQVKGHVRA